MVGNPNLSLTQSGDLSAKLNSFRGVEGLSRLFYFQLDVISSKQPEDYFNNIHAFVNWQINLEKSRLFNGMINRIAHVGVTLDGMQHYRVFVVPQVWLLTQEIKSRTFVQKTVPEIVKSILKQAGITAFTFQNCQAPYIKRDFVSQYFVPTWQFIERLLAEEGIFYYFESDQNKHTLHFADNKQIYKLEPPLVQKHITDWEEQYSLGVEQFVLQDYNYEMPDKVIEGSTTQARSNRINTIFAPNLMTDAATKRRAEFLMQSETQRLNRVRAKSTYEHLAPLVKLKDKVITQVFHCVSAPSLRGARTNVTRDAAIHYKNKCYLINSATCFRPPQIKKAQTKGLDIAKVVGATKPVSTDSLARVQVNFTWQPDQTPSKPLRVSHWMADKKWGTQFIPHVGDTVLIAYEYDDPERPVIVGSLYQGDQALPLQPKIKTLKHEIQFLDKENSFNWYSGGDFIMRAEAFSNTIQGDQEIDVQQGDYTVQVENGELVIEAKQSIELKAGGSSIRIDSGSITLTSDSLCIS